MKQQTTGNFDDFNSYGMGSDSRRSTYMDGGGSGSNRGGSMQLFADSTNLYKSILNDVASRDDMKESHLLVLGDRSAGKRSII